MRDAVTGRRLKESALNRTKLSDYELYEYMMNEDDDADTL